MTKENKKEEKKNTEVIQSINIAECFEIQRNLRLLFKNLLNSKTENEADQNRLKALKYIFETDILKVEYEKRLKVFEKTSKTKKYKNACNYISAYIWEKLKENAKDNNHEVEIKNYQNDEYAIKVYDKKTLLYYYFDIPHYCLYQSLNYPRSDKNIRIANSLQGFIYSIDKNTLLTQINSPIYFPEIKDTEENIKFRDNYDYIFNANIIYKISLFQSDMFWASSDINELRMLTCFYCSSLCEVLTELDYYISYIIKSEFKIDENLSEKEMTIKCYLEHPNWTTQKIANHLGKSKTTIRNQLGSKKQIDKNIEKYQYLLKD